MLAAALGLLAVRPARAQTEANPLPATVDPAAALTTDNVRTSWMLRFGGGAVGFRSSEGHGSSVLFGGAVEYYSARLLTGRLYLITGASFVLGQLTNRRCAVGDCAEENDPNLGESHGFGAAWGPSASFVLKLAPGREYLAVWFPEVRVQNVLGDRARRNAACTAAFGRHGCSGWSFDNAVVTAGIGVELAHGDGMSCGLDAAFGWAFGALPGRNEGLGGAYSAERTVLFNLIYNYDHYVPIRR